MEATTAEPTFEGMRSSFRLWQNAKGETQIEVKVYVGDDEHDLEQTRQTAIRLYRETREALGR